MKHAGKLLLFLVATLGIAVAGERPINPLQWVTLRVPGESTTYITAINNSGVMVGYYVDATVQHGLIVEGNKFRTLDVPGSSMTSCWGINSAGWIVGSFETASGELKGFLYQNGKFTYIDPTGNGAGAFGINDMGQIVGDYVPAPNQFPHGFLLDGTALQDLIPPGSAGSVATGINNLGQVVLSWKNSQGYYEGSLFDGTTYTTIDVPGAVNSYTGNINNAGDVAFEFGAAGQFFPHGAVLHAGEYHKFVAPGSDFTDAIGINDAGTVVGVAATLKSRTTVGFKLIP